MATKLLATNGTACGTLELGDGLSVSAGKVVTTSPAFAFIRNPNNMQTPKTSWHTGQIIPWTAGTNSVSPSATVGDIELDTTNHVIRFNKKGSYWLSTADVMTNNNNTDPWFNGKTTSDAVLEFVQTVIATGATKRLSTTRTTAAFKAGNLSEELHVKYRLINVDAGDTLHCAWMQHNGDVYLSYIHILVGFISEDFATDTDGNVF